MNRLLASALLAMVSLVTAQAMLSSPRPIDESSGVAAMPLAAEELPKGPNFSLYQANCLTCHTSIYVINSPKSPRKFWEDSVKKMVDLYAAPISVEKQKLIVDYLMAVRGASEAAPASN